MANNDALYFSLDSAFQRWNWNSSIEPDTTTSTIAYNLSSYYYNPDLYDVKLKEQIKKDIEEDKVDFDA